ncbi:hypothetical protein C2S53_015367 [Perilla frutescens var. hirtella]|uniref:Uncharacterized protein n=1 Tax=Perilla frutescens var. hirtella TaxID=608512 RepID=A0AAD4P673_PERFH|nr:hypothetical protein C2S53_015367 [Perilla frutescens var. hirtella]
MAPDAIFLGFFIFLLSKSQMTETARAMKSLSHCQTKCGEMEIPYPFGMKKGCYLDKTFEVMCNDSTGSATLASLGWEVKDISVSNSTLRRKDFNVETFKAKSDEWLTLSLDLVPAGNQYWISHNKNTFVVKGCDFLAYLYDSEVTLGVCASTCNHNPKKGVPLLPSTCQGLNCCQMDLLNDIRNCSLDVLRLSNSTDDHCGFFTFIDTDYLSSHLNFSVCKKRYTVPVVYEWAVGNTSCDRRNVCKQNSECYNYTTHTGYKCKCRKGYEGNPYHPEGCQDINECKRKYNPCSNNNRCVNTEGRYYCLPNRRHKLELAIPLGIGLALGLLLLVATGIWIWHKVKMIKNREMKQRFFKRNGGLLLQQQVTSSRASVSHELTLFKIEELEKATDKFSGSRILGKGGAGTIYKGMLSDGRIVAVKKANITNDSEIGQFVNEVCILSQISHRHIIKLFGCCLEAEVPLLVYEHISNSTLSHHIHNEQSISALSWENRLRIAAEVAGALAYLHSYASTAIFHRDIKSSNILLDENYRAVIADFGLSRSVSIDRTHLTTLVGGTFGYLDPEYFQSGQLNDKSDVYAYGVVLAEILTGQKAVSSAKDDIGLAIRFRSALKHDRLYEILDKVVAEEGQKHETLAVAKLAKRCLKINARKRPSMKEVAAELDRLRKMKELQKHQESFCHEHCSKSEKFYSSGIESEAGDDQTLSE